MTLSYPLLYTGTLPTTLGLLTNLKHLKLEHNSLTGSIPSVLGNLISIQELTLNNNKFILPVPQALGQDTNLQILNLGNNLLTGTVPSQLTLLTNLQFLGLNNNYLTGRTLPLGFPPNGPVNSTTPLIQNLDQSKAIVIQASQVSSACICIYSHLYEYIYPPNP